MVPDGCLSHLLVHLHLVLIPVLLPPLPGHACGPLLAGSWPRYSLQLLRHTQRALAGGGQQLQALDICRLCGFLLVDDNDPDTWMVMSYYLLLSLRLKDRFCPVPWILQHILLEIVLLALMVVLLMDLGNTARMQLEDKMGSGNFAMVVTGLIAASVYVFFCIMVARLHIMEQVELMNMHTNKSTIVVFIYDEMK